MKDDEIIKNPNIFLTVKESNFKESEEEARVIPEELDRYEDFTLKGALEICGLNRERYVRLIQGVFAQFYAKRSERKPLYICGLEEEKIPALLYCICMGVPYSMRRNLSCATANLNESLKKNLIFSDSYGASDWYLDVRTGQNNILTNRVMNRLERYGYVTAFPNRWDNPDLGQQFFEALEALAVKLGNPQASDAIILKIAYQMLKYPDMDALVERFDEETLNEKLYEALSSRSENSQYMDSYIARMLERATGQGWRFRDEIEDFLEEKLDHTQNQELLQAGEAYDISCISQCEPEKGAKKLNRLREDKFKVYSRKLVELPNGGEILDVYYSSYALKGEISWKILGDLLRESSYVPKRPLTIDRAEEEAWKLYTSLLDKDESPVKTYESYMEIMSLASEDPGRRKSYERAAKEEYWEHITMEKFSISKRDEYAFFNIFDYPNSKFFIGLLNLLIHVIKREFSKELLIEVTDFAAYNRNAFDEKGRNIFMDLLEDAASRRGGVMEEDDAPRLHIIKYAAAYLPGAEALPVEAVRVPLHGGHAEGRDRVYDVVVVLAVGAAEERGPRPGNCLDFVVAGRDFGRNRVHIQLRHMRMRIRVVHDLHAGPGEGEDALGVFVHPFPHEEEGRLHAVAAQDIYELGRVLVAPGGVEAQRNVLPVPLHAVHGQAALHRRGPHDRRGVHRREYRRRRQDNRQRAAERPPLPGEMHYIP